LRDVLPRAWHRPELSRANATAAAAAASAHRAAAQQQQGGGGIGLLGSMLSPGTAASDRSGARAHGGGGGGRAGPAHSLGIAWDDGESDAGPSPMWLARVWGLVGSLLRASPEWQTAEGEVDVGDLDGWPLLPATGGHLLYVAHRALVLVAPPPTSPPQVSWALLCFVVMCYAVLSCAVLRTPVLLELSADLAGRVGLGEHVDVSGRRQT
jgi:hypothetical protein